MSVLIEINDYYGIFISVRLKISCPTLIRAAWKCKMVWYSLFFVVLMVRFGAQFFNIHSNFCQMKKLFIKYAGCLYSIKDWSTCQNRYHLPSPSISLAFIFPACQFCDCIAIETQMKSTCTYWLGTQHTLKLLSMMILQIFPLFQRALTTFFAHISYEWFVMRIDCSVLVYCTTTPFAPFCTIHSCIVGSLICSDFS